MKKIITTVLFGLIALILCIGIPSCSQKPKPNKNEFYKVRNINVATSIDSLIAFKIINQFNLEDLSVNTEITKDTTTKFERYIIFRTSPPSSGTGLGSCVEKKVDRTGDLIYEVDTNGCWAHF